MRTLLYGAIISLAVGINVTAQAQTTDPQMMVPINKFLEAFNKGDVAGAAATKVLRQNTLRKLTDEG